MKKVYKSTMLKETLNYLYITTVENDVTKSLSQRGNRKLVGIYVLT